MGELSKWVGVDLSTLTPHEQHLIELGAGSSQEDPRTPEQRAAERARSEKLHAEAMAKYAAEDAERATLEARLNAGMGQYLKVGNFVVPIVLPLHFEVGMGTSASHWRAYQEFETNGHAYHRAWIKIGKAWKEGRPGRWRMEDKWEHVFRLADAPNDTPWMLWDEFRPLLGE